MINVPGSLSRGSRGALELGPEQRIGEKVHTPMNRRRPLAYIDSLGSAGGARRPLCSASGLDAVTLYAN